MAGRATTSPNAPESEPATIDVSTAGAEFGALVDRVEREGGRVVIERAGKPVAAVVSLRDLARLQADDEGLSERRKLLDEFAEPFKDIPPEEIQQEVDRAIAEHLGAARLEGGRGAREDAMVGVLGVQPLALDGAPRFLAHRRIVEQHELHLEDGVRLVLVQRVDLRHELDEFAARGRDRFLEARALRRDVAGLDRPPRHVVARACFSTFASASRVSWITSLAAPDSREAITGSIAATVTIPVRDSKPAQSSTIASWSCRSARIPGRRPKM